MSSVPGAGAASFFTVHDFVGAVGHLVQNRPGVGPQPSQGPQHAAEYQRQQAQALDGLGLRVVILLGDFLRENMHLQEHADAHDRRDDQHDPGEHVGRRI